MEKTAPESGPAGRGLGGLDRIDFFLNGVGFDTRLATFTRNSLTSGLSRLAQHIGSPGPLKPGFSLVLDVSNAGDISGFVFADHAQPVG